MKAEDGKMRLTDVADTEQLLRLIQSIPSPKAEPFKIWLAEVEAKGWMKPLTLFDADGIWQMTVIFFDQTTMFCQKKSTLGYRLLLLLMIK